MTEETVKLLLNLLNQVSIKAGEEKFEEITAAIVLAKKELLVELEKWKNQ